MKKVTQEVYDRIDNDLYHEKGDLWRQSDSPLCLIQSSINPARIGYFKKILFDTLNVNLQGKAALEIGCGGGILCEEIARMGMDVTGIDPSEQSLQIATSHAKESNLQIQYEKGIGEALSFRDSSFDFVFCCDTLEHVRDVPKVISEISRVLKPEGTFFYDTFNRTFMSKLVAIYISQVWKWWAFAPPNLHVWQMFIKPDELISLLRQNHLEWQATRGMQPNVSLIAILRCLRKRARGELTYKNIGEKLFLVESSNISIMYIGYANKSK